jgi:hypothetical protein
MRLQIASASQSSSRLEAREITDPKAVVSETAKDAVPIPIVFDRNLKQRASSADTSVFRTGIYLVMLLDSFCLFSFAGSSVPDLEGGLFLRSPMYL